MAAEATKCSYCNRPVPYRHSPNCPSANGVPDPIMVKEWERGARTGFADDPIPWYLLRHYSPAFQLGYRIGKAEIDAIADDAAQSRCFR